MKRVVMMGLMTVITSLFAFSVYAAPSPGASYSTSISSDDNNITAFAYAVYEEGVYQLSSQGTEITSPSLLISIRVVNNTDKWVIKDTDQFKFRVNGIYAITYPFEFVDIDNCTITEVATATGRADLTIKGNNSFILAPNENYVISFRMVVYDGFNTPSIQFFNNQFLNSAYTTDELVSLPADELAYLSSLNIDIQTLIDVCSYTGSNYSPSLNSSASYDSTLINNVNVPDLQTRVYRILSSEYYLNNDIEFNNTDDSVNNTGTKVRIMSVRLLLFNNNSSQYIRLTDQIAIDNVIPSGVVAYEITSIDSQDFNIVGFLSNNSNATGRRLYFRFINSISNYGYIGPKHRADLIVQFKLYYDDDAVLTYYDPSLNISTAPRLVSDIYAPRSVYELLRDLYLSLVKKEADDNTQEASEMNDEIHDAEQVWYDNNSEALEQVGLSNYRFSQSQSSGIYQAVTQFQAVWNALGDWTNVYIFILILSISTYIIRHEPTTRVKQYRSSVQAERAERISYYGRKNAESRAASSNSTLKNAIRRRK